MIPAIAVAREWLRRDETRDVVFVGTQRGIESRLVPEAGLKLDRRTEFPRKATNLTLEPELEVPAFALGPMRRGLAESVEPPRVQAAGD